MRVLTVRQPWAWAIIHGGKDVENRVRNIAGDYRGPVAIHVAQTEDANAFSLSETREVLDAAAARWMDAATRARPKSVETVPWARDHGRIIGVVDLTDVHWSGMECSRGLKCHEYELCSPWAQAYHEHLVLANPRPLAEPIPYRGALGLRTLDEAAAGRVLEAVA
ncbi:hypothetical protein [Microbacterium rhizophilus]|uniref:hypothetical protein n=1 Tax=Microbacterium rhizophilus TaxID=3138934 RepID=UPI0031EC7248